MTNQDDAKVERDRKQYEMFERTQDPARTSSNPHQDDIRADIKKLMESFAADAVAAFKTYKGFAYGSQIDDAVKLYEQLLSAQRLTDKEALLAHPAFNKNTIVVQPDVYQKYLSKYGDAEAVAHALAIDQVTAAIKEVYGE